MKSEQQGQVTICQSPEQVLRFLADHWKDLEDGLIQDYSEKQGKWLKTDIGCRLHELCTDSRKYRVKPKKPQLFYKWIDMDTSWIDVIELTPEVREVLKREGLIDD